MIFSMYFMFILYMTAVHEQALVALIHNHTFLTLVSYLCISGLATLDIAVMMRRVQRTP